MNFSTLVNRVRSELVAHALKQGSKQDILDLALDAGFASKASFNRAFSATFGVTPSAYRRSVSDSKNKPDEVVLGRPIEADERKLSS